MLFKYFDYVCHSNIPDTGISGCLMTIYCSFLRGRHCEYIRRLSSLLARPGMKMFYRKIDLHIIT